MSFFIYHISVDQHQMFLSKTSLIWARCGQVIRHDIRKLQHKASFMTSCIVSNEIAKTPEKDEGKDDKDNEIDQWKSN